MLNSLIPKRDFIFGAVAGMLIGLLALPILRTAKPDLYDQLWLMVVPFFLAVVPAGLIIAYKLSQKITLFWQLGKFGVIGVLNTLVDLGVLAFLTLVFRQSFAIGAEEGVWQGRLGSSLLIVTWYSIFKALSFIAANINSYLWNKHWTFNQGDREKTAAEFVQFFFVSVVGFALNVSLASYVFKSVGPLGDLNHDQWGLIGAIAGSLAGLAWNFIGYKLWVFKK